MEMITFGKYKGKTYEEVSKTDNSYCTWVLSEERKSGPIRDFYIFLKNNKPKNSAGFLKNVGIINCSQLSKHLERDDKIVQIINELDFVTKRIDTIIKNIKFSATSFGQFIDYLIRYILSVLSKQKFKDNRTEFVLLRQNDFEYFDFDDFDEDESDKIVLDQIKKSYEELQKNDDLKYNEKIILNVLNISKSHSIFFGNKDYESIDSSAPEIQIWLAQWQKSYETIMNFCEERIKDKQTILLNPVLGRQRIGADADLIIDQELIDFKVSQYSKTKSDFVQLIVYAMLYEQQCIDKKKSNMHHINTLTIYNPLLGEITSTQISQNIIEQFREIINSYFDEEQENF